MRDTYEALALNERPACRASGSYNISAAFDGRLEGSGSLEATTREPVDILAAMSCRRTKGSPVAVDAIRCILSCL